LKKKNYTKGLSPYGRATGGIFEIIQNGYIFLKFLFFLNIKKKKAQPASSCEDFLAQEMAFVGC